MLEEPEVWGVQALANDAVTLRISLKTAPLAQWRVAREMRERVKARFDHEGIVLGAGRWLTRRVGTMEG